MAYDDYELSVDDSQPDELYAFQYAGDGSTYRITSSAYQIISDGQTYDPVPVKRTPIKRTGEIGKNEVTVTLDRNNPFFARYLASVRTYPTTLTIYSLQPDGSFKEIWLGVVRNIRKTKDEMEVATSPVSSNSARPIIHRKYQVQCPHALFGYHCGVLKGSFSVSGTIDSISGNVIESSAFGAKPDGWLTGGFVVVGSDEKTIVAHTGDFITVLDPFYEVSAGDAVQAFAGCDHSLDTCDSKFSNSDGYGGFPWIPQDDKLTTGKPFTY